MTLQEQIIAKQKELIYQLSKQPNAIGKEWRERVERLESELAALEAKHDELSQVEQQTREEMFEFAIWFKNIYWDQLPVIINDVKKYMNPIYIPSGIWDTSITDGYLTISGIFDYWKSLNK